MYRQTNAHDHITDENIERLVVAGVEIDQILSVGDRCVNGNIPAGWIIMAGWKNIEDECLPTFGGRWLPIEVLMARMRQVGTVGRASMYIAESATWTLTPQR